MSTTSAKVSALKYTSPTKVGDQVWLYTSTIIIPTVASEFDVNVTDKSTHCHPVSVDTLFEVHDWREVAHAHESFIRQAIFAPPPIVPVHTTFIFPLRLYFVFGLIAIPGVPQYEVLNVFISTNFPAMVGEILMHGPPLNHPVGSMVVSI